MNFAIIYRISNLLFVRFGLVAFGNYQSDFAGGKCMASIAYFVVTVVGIFLLENLNIPEHFIIIFAIVMTGFTIRITLSAILYKMIELIEAIHELKDK